MAAHVYSPNIESGDKYVLRASSTARLAKIMSFLFKKRPSLCPIGSCRGRYLTSCSGVYACVLQHMHTDTCAKNLASMVMYGL